MTATFFMETFLRIIDYGSYIMLCMQAVKRSFQNPIT